MLVNRNANILKKKFLGFSVFKTEIKNWLKTDSLVGSQFVKTNERNRNYVSL